MALTVRTFLIWFGVTLGIISGLQACPYEASAERQHGLNMPKQGISVCVCVCVCYFNAKIYFTKEKEAAFLMAEEGRRECLSILGF